MRYFYILGGFISLGLGFIGAFLPILPTTPFAILAAFLFSKSSPRLEQWILDLPAVGPLVKDWRQHKVINPKAKILCVLTIIIVMSLSIYSVQPKWWASTGSPDCEEAKDSSALLRADFR